jgi:hypothetical protein
MKSKLQNLYKSSVLFLTELKRTSWALFFVGFGLLFLFRSGREIFAQQAGVLLWKLLVLGCGIQVAHVTRKSLFPYIDLSKALDEKNEMTFVAIAIVYGAIILGLCLSL